MKNTIPVIILLIALSACKQNNVAPSNSTQRTIDDTLMVYSVTDSTGNSSIITKRFKEGEVKTVAQNAASPYASNMRLVYIKDGNSLGFSRFDGVSKLLIQLTQPNYPCLSVDTRLICVVDHIPGKYQLLLYDTLGNKNILFETENEIASPSFTEDDQNIVYAQNTTPGEYQMFIIPMATKVPRQLTPATMDSCDNNCTATGQQVYFTQTRIINSKPSSEIFSVNLDGSGITKRTNFTSNFTTTGFTIKHLRRVNNSALIYISNYNTHNNEIYLWKTSDETHPVKMTGSEESESFPSLIPEFAKE